EVERTGAGVALGSRDVTNRNGWHAVVVGDGAETLSVGDRGVARVGQIDGEGLVGLVGVVAVDLHGDGLDGLAGGEADRARRRRVVRGSRRSAVVGGVVDRDGLVRGVGQ